MYFTPKTTFNVLTGGNNPDINVGDIVSPEDFTKIIFNRSRYCSSYAYVGFEEHNTSEQHTQINKYFTNQIDTCSDANAFTLLMMPFSKWHDVMLKLGYTVH